MDLPSSSGASMRWVPHDTHAWVPAKVLEQTDSMVSVELSGGRQQTLALEDAPRVVMSTISRTYSDLSDMEDFAEKALADLKQYRSLREVLHI